jgi:hypothetical protein
MTNNLLKIKSSCFMKNLKLYFVYTISIFIWSSGLSYSQTAGLNAINVDEMKYHLKFLSSVEFQGRSTPSTALDIASRYIAMTAEKIGLKPLLPDGSFLQKMKAEVFTISQAKSFIELKSGSNDRKYYFPESFCANMRSYPEGTVSGEMVFLGFGFYAPEMNWDDYTGIDMKGKIAVIIDPQLPSDHKFKPVENRQRIVYRYRKAIEKGAIGIVSIISQEREDNLVQKNTDFDNTEFVRFPDISQQPSGYPIIEIRHDIACDILGVSKDEIKNMYNKIINGKQAPGRTISGKNLKISIKLNKRTEETSNVVAYLPGSDPLLSKEYVVIGSHHDHLNTREGKVYPGSDDNASGCVGMFEIAKGLILEKPKRSVVFVWHTAEEKGLIGAYYFIAHSPVPPEKISVMLNLDMISRNDPNSLYLIGSNKLSTEFDQSINRMNDKYIKMHLDYKYESPKHPDRFFFRSDQYPYITYGIPGVWFFCGTTEDYHQDGDVFEKADFKKMENVTKLVMLAAIDIANKPELLKLDITPDITTRGKHNTKINWLK